MATEPNPHVTKAGRWLLYTVGGLAGVILLTVLVNGCIRKAPRVVERPWGQGYDTPTGQYMQPDHGFFYYWMWTQVLRSNVQPTYHVYLPPGGAPTWYRPWHEREYYRDSTGRFTKRPAPAPSSGGFTTSKPAWSSSPSYSKPNSGGFNRSTKPTYSAPSRPSSGGFSAPRSAPSRPSSGGFSSRPSTPSRPSSGGFRR